MLYDIHMGPIMALLLGSHSIWNDRLAGKLYSTNIGGGGCM